ncbi:MAG: MBL fold metallo-hydrolase [Dehalococcoidales bacterium]|nr:MBL fold metallo-hydrolase [Dehalococcoidales bacterium]
MENSITFLGTGGARLMVASQMLASGGIWLNLNGTEILVDPGPGCIVHAIRNKLNPENLSAIILSHRHLDHSADLNIMVEAMTRGGFKPHGILLAPADAFGPEPVIYSYLKERLDAIEIMQAGKFYTIDSASMNTPVKHVHGVETYGIVFKTPDRTFSYIADTKFFKELNQHYATDLIIINVVMMEQHWPIDHLSINDVEQLVADMKPRAAIITHFGTAIYQANPPEIARQISIRTGIRVIAARDDMKFDLDKMEVV